MNSNHDRPALPQGPYLVVGLARSGRAIARTLAARGERVLGCDSGRPQEAEGLAEEGVEVSLDADGIALLEHVRTVVKSPGVPGETAVICAPRRIVRSTNWISSAVKNGKRRSSPSRNSNRERPHAVLVASASSRVRETSSVMTPMSKEVLIN